MHYIIIFATHLVCLFDDIPISDCLLLILANKQDHPLSKDTEEITELLKLREICGSNRKWHISGVCALNGKGLKESFKWIKDGLSQQEKIIRNSNIF